LADFSPDDKVLDCGCGTGKVMCTVAPYVGNVEGIDISEEMVSQIDLSEHPNANACVGSITDLDYPDNSFDKVTARLVFHHILKDEDLKKARWYLERAIENLR